MIASIPPTIASLDYYAAPALISDTEEALLAIARTDADATGQSQALARFMLRTESVASSKIERVIATSEDYARALSGSRSNTSATSMVAASAALQSMVDHAGSTGQIEMDDILVAHHALMRDDPEESDYAGRIRDMQNWIGGSDYSPRNALYVPPPPDYVETLMTDLVTYVNRDDIPVMIQASIAHAQFESVHPFTDGNGRIGRALVSSILRRRGVAKSVVVPLASGILAVRDAYFAALTAYREGRVEPIVSIVARASKVAATEAQRSIRELNGLPDTWRTELRVRSGSAVEKLIPAIFDDPVMGADDMVQAVGGNTAAAYAAIERLEKAGIIREITGRKRDRVWVASDVMGELDDLDLRIQQAVAETTGAAAQTRSSIRV